MPNICYVTIGLRIPGYKKFSKNVDRTLKKLMTKSGPPTRLAPSEYEAIERAMMETARGRWFLAQFAENNRREDTTVVLEAIDKLQSSMATTRSGPEVDRIKRDLVEMCTAIARMRVEIYQLKFPEQDENNILETAEELEAIVDTAERTTREILESAEGIQEMAWTIREESGMDAQCARIDQEVTDIYNACAYQEVSGQRTQKLVRVLRYLEARINAMVSIWGLEEELLKNQEQKSTEKSPQIENANAATLLLESAPAETVSNNDADENTENTSVLEQEVPLSEDGVAEQLSNPDTQPDTQPGTQDELASTASIELPPEAALEETELGETDNPVSADTELASAIVEAIDQNETPEGPVTNSDLDLASGLPDEIEPSSEPDSIPSQAAEQTTEIQSAEISETIVEASDLTNLNGDLGEAEDILELSSELSVSEETPEQNQTPAETTSDTPATPDSALHQETPIEDLSSEVPSEIQPPLEIQSPLTDDNASTAETLTDHTETAALSEENDISSVSQPDQIEELESASAANVSDLADIDDSAYSEDHPALSDTPETEESIAETIAAKLDEKDLIEKANSLLDNMSESEAASLKVLDGGLSLEPPETENTGAEGALTADQNASDDQTADHPALSLLSDDIENMEDLLADIPTEAIAGETSIQSDITPAAQQSEIVSELSEHQEPQGTSLESNNSELPNPVAQEDVKEPDVIALHSPLEDGAPNQKTSITRDQAQFVKQFEKISRELERQAHGSQQSDQTSQASLHSEQVAETSDKPADLQPVLPNDNPENTEADVESQSADGLEAISPSLDDLQTIQDNLDQIDVETLNEPSPESTSASTSDEAPTALQPETPQSEPDQTQSPIANEQAESAKQETEPTQTAEGENSTYSTSDWVGQNLESFSEELNAEPHSTASSLRNMSTTKKTALFD